MKNRKGTSLTEALVMLVPALLILGAALMLMVRSASHDAFNDAKLSALDAALIANERLQADLAGARRVTAEDAALTTERAAWTHAGKSLARDGKPLRAAPLKSATFALDGAVLTMTLGAGDVPVTASAHLIEQESRMAWATWTE